jgi:hypothetical protein
MVLIYWVKTTVNKNKEASLVTSKKTGLEVNAEKTHYTVMSPEQKEEKKIIP